MTETGRRTQAERRAATIARLVDATIDSIADVGYHRTSLGEICSRSGVSRGGLFRHFESRLDLVVATAEEVLRRHVERFEEQFRAGGLSTVADQVRFVRSASRDRINTVWFELLVAARTEPGLRARLAPVATTLHQNVDALALITHPGSLAEEDLRVLTTSVLHLFDGEAVFRHTFPRPELEEARLERVVELATRLVGDSPEA
ncbi:TetR/AcrR family transcriptional regulator [Nocardioides sp.]|uniref:TetR/AcrR family transcriptional regulator n=1 Tax=Nocardioides sp. TaxID=35761 RepID=UPI0027376BFC|nr:TetR/AcrR family transcriptional regulator [Nocardioides sp.]MDP3891964.1 TetR/AcrR family transcriptional regulator [Nocardioides sp.]